MKTLLNLALFVSLALAFAAPGLAQDPAEAEQNAENLRAQLREVIAKQAELQTRAQQIEEDLKPENIDRSIALIGTTQTDELREQRRRELENQQSRVREQLDQLAASRTRLESAIAAAEAEADRLRANIANPQPPPSAGNTTPRSQPSSTVHTRSSSATENGRPRKRRARRRARRHPSQSFRSQG